MEYLPFYIMATAMLCLAAGFVFGFCCGLRFAGGSIRIEKAE